MKAFIAYGTGRGTTATIADAIAYGLKGGGVKAVAVSVEYLTADLLATADIIGIGSPVHFYREARYMTRFLSELAALDGKRAFVFCTCGMDRPGETLARLHAALVTRGAVVVGAESFSSAMSYPPLRERGLGNGDQFPGEAGLARARSFGERMARAPELEPLAPPAVSWLTHAKARLLATVPLRRLVFPGISINRAACTGYGSCLSRCLTRGLDRKDGESIPFVTDECVRCLECLAWCPRGAIVLDSKVKAWTATVNYRLGIH